MNSLNLTAQEIRSLRATLEWVHSVAHLSDPAHCLNRVYSALCNLEKVTDPQEWDKLPESDPLKYAAVLGTSSSLSPLTSPNDET